MIKKDGHMKKSKKKSLLVMILVIGMITLFLYTQNNLIHIQPITLSFENLPKSFDGFKIVHLSDLHGKSFGKNQNNLIDKVKFIDPDLIVFTGDLVDSNHYDETPGLVLMKALAELSPVYFVMGNHEHWSSKSIDLEKKLEDIGVTVLRDESIFLEHQGSKIQIIGIDDPSISKVITNDAIGKQISNASKSYEKLKENTFKILLAHRPELFSAYTKANMDLIFSGHAHGGQFRLPFLGGLIAPDQGWLPKYTAGQYHKDHAVMVVTRGLGNSIIPQRLFNRPEIVIVTLENK